MTQLWRKDLTASIESTSLKSIQILKTVSFWEVPTWLTEGADDKSREGFYVIGFIGAGGAFHFGRFSNQQEAEGFADALRQQMKEGD